MPEPTTTTGEEPLTPEELELLARLEARRAAAAAAQAERDRQAKLAALADADTLVNLVLTPQVRAAIDKCMNSTTLDYDTKSRIGSFKTSLEYNIGGIKTTIDALKTPTTSSSTPVTTPSSSATAPADDTAA